MRGIVVAYVDCNISNTLVIWSSVNRSVHSSIICNCDGDCSNDYDCDSNGDSNGDYHCDNDSYCECHYNPDCDCVWDEQVICDEYDINNW